MSFEQSPRYNISENQNCTAAIKFFFFFYLLRTLTNINAAEKGQIYCKFGNYLTGCSLFWHVNKARERSATDHHSIFQP